MKHGSVDFTRFRDTMPYSVAVLEKLRRGYHFRIGRHGDCKSMNSAKRNNQQRIKTSSSLKIVKPNIYIPNVPTLEELQKKFQALKAKDGSDVSIIDDRNNVTSWMSLILNLRFQSGR